MPTNVLVVGATRGLGLEIAKQYLAKDDHVVFGTTRSSTAPDKDKAISQVHWITDIDVGEESAGPNLAKQLRGHNITALHAIYISAGYFGKESFTEPDFAAEVKMYRTSAIGPVFLVHALHAAQLLEKQRSKIVLISSESGSIALRHISEGGGNFAHHGSKAALNMVGKLLSLDLHDDGVAVALIHPGFMRTEMTKSVGFDQFWDDGGAVLPSEAAQSVVRWTEDHFTLEKSGTYWAPRGPRDIGTAEFVLGPKDKLPVPLELPW